MNIFDIALWFDISLSTNSVTFYPLSKKHLGHWSKFLFLKISITFWIWYMDKRCLKSEYIQFSSYPYKSLCLKCFLMASWQTNYGEIFTFRIRLFKSYRVTFGKMTIFMLPRLEFYIFNNLGVSACPQMSTICAKYNDLGKNPVIIRC